jgi:hypothetical protein
MRLCGLVKFRVQRFRVEGAVRGSWYWILDAGFRVGAGSVQGRGRTGVGALEVHTASGCDVVPEFRDR